MELGGFYPWNDRGGRFSWLRALLCAALAAPGLWIAWGLAADALGPEPYNAAAHLTGVWTLRIALAALAVTPLARRLGWRRLIGARRLVGLGAFAWLAAHFCFYILLQNGDLAMVAKEIAARFYLAIGFVALLGMAALAATSFDVAIRRMGAGWRRLHRLVYPLTALGILHYFLQSKIDVGGAALLFGVFAGLMLHRAFARPPPPAALVVALAAVFGAAAAAGGEALWHAAMTGVPAERVLLANLDFRYEIRPPWIVLAVLASPLPVMLAAGLRRRYSSA